MQLRINETTRHAHEDPAKAPAAEKGGNLQLADATRRASETGKAKAGAQSTATAEATHSDSDPTQIESASFSSAAASEDQRKSIQTHSTVINN